MRNLLTRLRRWWIRRAWARQQQRPSVPPARQITPDEARTYQARAKAKPVGRWHTSGRVTSWFVTARQAERLNPEERDRLGLS